MKRKRPSGKPPRRTAKRTGDRRSGSGPKSEGSRATPYTFKEANHLKRLIEKEIPVLVRLRDNEEVVGLIEHHDSTSIRLSRPGAQNLIVLKTEIKYFYEQPDCGDRQPGEPRPRHEAG